MEPRSPGRAYSALNRWATPAALLLGPQLSLIILPRRSPPLNSPPLACGYFHNKLTEWRSTKLSAYILPPDSSKACNVVKAVCARLRCALQNADGSMDPHFAENRIVRHKREQVNPIKRGACFCSAQREIKAGKRLSAVSVSLN